MQVNMRPVHAFDEISWEEEFKIPEKIPVSSTVHCDVVKISYELNFAAKSRAGNIANLQLPITIGHIAIAEKEKRNSVQSETDEQSTPVSRNISARSFLPRKSSLKVYKKI